MSILRGLVFILLSIVPGVFLAVKAFALDDSRLWLPKSYQTFYVSLVNAALAAEETDRCVTVLEGTLDLDQSTPERPVFRILCRQESGVSYNEMVDGTDYKTLTTPASKDSYWSEESRRRRERERLMETYWHLCQTEIARQTRLMNELQWLTPMPAVPSSETDGRVSYILDFDAKTPEGRPLHYRLQCAVSESEGATVSILRRPD